MRLRPWFTSGPRFAFASTSGTAAAAATTVPTLSSTISSPLAIRFLPHCSSSFVETVDVLAGSRRRRPLLRPFGLPPFALSMPLCDEDRQIVEKVEALLGEKREDDDFAKKLSEALHNIDSAIDLFGTEGLCVSFNGGKDATVVFHLTRMAVARRLLSAEMSGGKDSNDVIAAAANSTTSIKALSLVSGVNFLPEKLVPDNPDEPSPVFPELMSFFEETIEKHGLKTTKMTLRKSDGKDVFKLALARFLEKGGPGEKVKAVIMGTRHTDPHAIQQKLSVFTPSSAGWPSFLRINPIMEWDHSDVWSFLLDLSLPYCSLYDQGYTSMGAPKDSKKNPSLRRPDGTYAPAHTLVSTELERSGRAPTTPKALAKPDTSAGALVTSESPSNQLTREDSLLHSFKVDTPVELPSKIDFLRRVQTCGILIIGNEILSGNVRDDNSHTISLRLRTAGITVSRISIVRDNAKEIAAEAKRLSEECDLVFTTGGVGPTHDDVTMKAIADIFGVERVRSATLESAIRCLYGTDQVNKYQLGMALVPKGAVLIDPNNPTSEPEIITDNEPRGEAGAFNSASSHVAASALFKIVLFKNIFILPGVPLYMKQKMRVITRLLAESNPERGILYRKFVIRRAKNEWARASVNAELLSAASQANNIDAVAEGRSRGYSESGLELEALLASTLTSIAEAYDTVNLCSYIDAQEIEEGKGTGSRQRITVVVEGRDETSVAAASRTLRQELAAGYEFLEESGRGVVHL